MLNKGKPVLVKFHKKIYQLKNIRSAVKAFHDFASFKVSLTRDYVEVTVDVTPAQDNRQAIIDEFKNYALFLNITHG